MSENNRSYRIRTNVGSEYNGELKLDLNLLQSYDEFEVLSLKIGTENLYRYHTSHYGCVVGRVLANGGVGVPNVKISAFIPVDDIDTADPVFSFLYPYSSTRDKNRDNIRYNLLTDTKLDDCHQNVGTFPNKRLVLDDNNVIEIYDKYYKFTTTTNGSGDYMLFGLPVGNNIIHSDLDLSDIGILSQKPRDLFYKGYTAKQFENASQFKKDTNLDNLTQVVSQDSSVYVFPFWGDETENEGQIKIVRNDIDVNYKFEPTCIFIGCIVSDEKSNAISKNCIPHERMGKMDRLTTGAGTIEMIRKTVSGDIESFSIQGNELIDGNGTWCYQIPMNLDYMATDEYGNLVPTDNYDKGLPTRTSVRFRISLADYESDYENAHLVKVLAPNNPQMKNNEIDYDYEFGSATRDSSFRDMFWNNVYTVKSYIPRFQKGNRQRNKNFTGFKAVNVNGANNPIPYNNMRINLTFLFVFQCLIFKSLVLIVKTLNKIIYVLNKITCGGGCGSSTFQCGGEEGPVYLTLDGGMCPTLEGNFIAPGAVNINQYNIIEHTYKNVFGEEFTIEPGVSYSDDDIVMNGTSLTVEANTALPSDKKSSDNKNSDLYSGNTISSSYTIDDIGSNGSTGLTSGETTEMKIFNEEDYFVKCVELQFAMEYEVIQFDFYNDWINGMIYIPRWFAEIRKNKDKAHYCGDTFSAYRYLTQQCAIAFNGATQMPNADSIFPSGCRGNKKQQCHKRWGRKQVNIFGPSKRGIVTAQQNSRGQYAYYLRPSERIVQSGTVSIVKANLFSTDIVLLGSVLDCNQYGIPKVKGYTSSSFKMPPPTAEIISDTQEMIFETKGTSDDVDLAKKVVISYLNEYNKNTVSSLLSTKFKNSVCATKNGVAKCGIAGIDDVGKTAQNWIDIIRKNNNGKTYDTNILSQLSEFSVENVFNESKYKNKILNIIARFSNDPNLDVRCEAINSFATALGKTCYENVELIFGEYNRLINNNSDITTFYKYFKLPVNKIQLDESNKNEPTYSEISGIDWGYTPFDSGSNDNTSLIKNQVAGHFLEIGCTFSLSNIKSCVNLQRVCELGGEISQSHYYLNATTNKWNLLDPTGIIAKREIIDGGIRTTFATLNSMNLGVMYNSMNGYYKYKFTPYSPVSFMGELENRGEIYELKTSQGDYKNYGLIENQSLSYKAFRFGQKDNFTNRFLIKNVVNGNVLYFMPQYENSFYFYFGLRDGNTAIDRLYTEYYAQCGDGDEMPSVSFIVKKTPDGSKYRLIYNTENMGMIKSIVVKRNNVLVKLGEGAVWDRTRSTIDVTLTGDYIITMKDVNGKIAKAKITVKEITTIPVVNPGGATTGGGTPIGGDIIGGGGVIVTPPTPYR